MTITQTISQRIQEAFYKATACGSWEPKSLYLGRQEWKELDREFTENCRFPVHDDVYCPRRKYNGMLVYRVDEPSHIGVA